MCDFQGRNALFGTESTWHAQKSGTKSAAEKLALTRIISVNLSMFYGFLNISAEFRISAAFLNEKNNKTNETVQNSNETIKIRPTKPNETHDMVAIFWTKPDPSGLQGYNTYTCKLEFNGFVRK